jgi:hypothetical protein
MQPLEYSLGVFPGGKIKNAIILKIEAPIIVLLLLELYFHGFKNQLDKELGKDIYIII